MKVYVANFGRGNHLWPSCLARNSIATFEELDTWPLWLAGDRDAYIEYNVANKITAAGISPTRGVASRWFNLGHIVSDTQGDLWIHRANQDLWWTISQPGQIDVVLEPSHTAKDAADLIHVLHKATLPWSNTNRKGNCLKWPALHAKARDFLTLQGTIQSLSDENAGYASALISGDDLSAWHNLPSWKTKAASAGKNAATIYNAVEKTAYRMVRTALDTIAGANGQQVLKTVKLKEFGFENDAAFEQYVKALLQDQEGLCAITDLKMQLDGEFDDPELRCSLDRIDSSKHYEPGNLQIVCRFVNRWKGADDDPGFRRLVALIRLYK